MQQGLLAIVQITFDTTAFQRALWGRQQRRGELKG